MLVVKRAGLSFKLLAHDEQTCETYMGYVYEPAILEMLDRNNKVIKRWQKDEVVQLLISRIALVDAVPAPTVELNKATRVIVLHQQLGPHVPTTGVRSVSMGRVLHDQYEAMRRYGPYVHVICVSVYVCMYV